MKTVKYLINGAEVHLINEVENGYLVRRVLYADMDEEEEGEPEEAESNIEFVDKFDESVDVSHEDLLLLEESSREVDLWLENKTVFVNFL